MTDTDLKSFVRVIEVWVPDGHGDRLILDGGLYGELTEFATLSGEEKFACGEGLPGKAWEDQLPVVITEFTEATFKRSEAAQAAGLTAGVAVPVFNGAKLNAVVVYLCGERGVATGAIEAWADNGLDEFGLSGGYYGDQERFEWISRRVNFPRGRGLPGRVWASGKPLLIGDLANSSSFLRSRNAAEAGITTAFAMPVYAPRISDEPSAVVAFLSSNNTPIARRFEIWDYDEDSHALTFGAALEQARGSIEPANRKRRISEGRGIIGEVCRSGVPRIANGLGPAPEASGDPSPPPGYDEMLAIPIMHEGRTLTVVVFYR